MMTAPDVKDLAVVFHRSQAWTDAASRGYELLIEDGRLKWSLIHFWPGNAISIRATALVPTNTWTHVVVSSDGSSRADGLRLFVNGQLASTDVIRDNLTKNITGGGHDNISLAERMRAEEERRARLAKVAEVVGLGELLDRKRVVRPRESIEWTRRLVQDCGIFAGLSSGASLAGAIKVAGEIDEGTIVFIVCDGGWKYLSTGAYTADLDEAEKAAEKIIYF